MWLSFFNPNYAELQHPDAPRTPHLEQCKRVQGPLLPSLSINQSGQTKWHLTFQHWELLITKRSAYQPQGIFIAHMNPML